MISKIAFEGTARGESRYKVLYVVPGTRTFAGIERVVDEVAAELATRFPARFDVDVLYLSRFENHAFGPRPYTLIQREPRTRTQLLRSLREVAGSAHYDLLVVPQVEATVLCWLACLGLGRRIAVHLHGNPSRERSHLRAKILFGLMGSVVLPRLASVFGTSPRQLHAFQRMFPSQVPHVWVPNPVRRFDSTSSSPRPDDLTYFVNVARFDYQKGQDLLVEAFSRVHRQRPNARLRLVGYGADEAKLRAAIAAAELEQAVTIEFHPESPQVALETSDIYVCTSRWEGWSLAICEALRFGLPVVSTDCEFGPSDILVDQRLGRLVALPGDDLSGIDDLVEAMIYYCDNRASELEHADFRRAYVERFSAEQVAQTHAEAIKNAAGAHR